MVINLLWGVDLVPVGLRVSAVCEGCGLSLGVGEVGVGEVGVSPNPMEMVAIKATMRSFLVSIRVVFISD